MLPVNSLLCDNNIMLNVIFTKLFKLKLSNKYSVLNVYLFSVIISILFIVGGIVIVENKSYFQSKQNAINSKYDCGTGSFGQCLEVEVSKTKAEFFSFSVTESKILAAALITIAVVNFSFETRWFKHNYVKNIS